MHGHAHLQAPTISKTGWQCATIEDIAALFMAVTAVPLNAAGYLFKSSIPRCAPRSLLSCCLAGSVCVIFYFYPANVRPEGPWQQRYCFTYACSLRASPGLLKHWCAASFIRMLGLQLVISTGALNVHVLHEEQVQ